MILKSKVELSKIDKEIFKNFDYSFNGESTFEVPVMPSIEKDFSIGVIFGSSGSGKALYLKVLDKIKI